MQRLIGIAAVDDEYGISKNGKIPWTEPSDTAFFKAMIKDSVIIVGKNTANEMKKLIDKEWCKALILSTKGSSEPNFGVVNYLGALRMIENIPEDVKIFVCGGCDIYHLFEPFYKEFYLTRIEGKFGCDQILHINGTIKSYFYLPPSTTADDYIFCMSQYTYFVGRDDYESFDTDVLKKVRDIVKDRKKIKVEFVIFGAYNYESEFLDIGIECINRGRKVQTRNALTRSIFSKEIYVNLHGGLLFPLLTTRKLFFRGIFEELMIYLRGQTDNNILVKKKVNVWTANTTREFLDSRGLQHLPEGDMGNSYGFAMRHFGAKYKDCHTDYTGQGFDQLMNLIEGLKKDPYSRRHIITLWNPAAVNECPLPPCLWTYQFYVSGNLLSCKATQRSSDYAVAGGWNIATIALFTMLLAKTLDLIPHELIWNIGDLHVYEDHVQDFLAQYSRPVKAPPRLIIKSKKPITEYEFEDLQLVGYNPHPIIPFKMLA